MAISPQEACRSADQTALTQQAVKCKPNLHLLGMGGRGGSSLHASDFPLATYGGEVVSECMQVNLHDSAKRQSLTSVGSITE